MLTICTSRYDALKRAHHHFLSILAKNAYSEPNQKKISDKPIYKLTGALKSVKVMKDKDCGTVTAGSRLRKHDNPM